MRGRYGFRQIRIGMTLALALGLLSACQSRTVDYEDSEMIESAVTEKSSARKGVEQFADAPKWQDEWKAKDEEGNVVSLSVAANVTLPDAGQMYVVEVEETVFDEAYMERVAKALFGNETVYYNDLLHYTRRELEERYADDLEWLRTAEGWEPHYDGYESEIGLIEELLETAGDTYTPISAYDVKEYRGERDGILYELTFDESEMDIWLDPINKSVSLVPADETEVFPDKFANVDVGENVGFVSYYGDEEGEYLEGRDLQNQCALSAGEAQNIAEDFVERLGMEYSVCSAAMQLLWEYTTYAPNEDGELRPAVSDEVKDGYLFWFDIGIDEQSFVAYGTQRDYRNFIYKKQGEETCYGLRSRLTVYVTDKGVIKMTADNPLTIIGVSKGVEMLPLATVQEIIEDQVINNFNSFRWFYYDAQSHGRNQMVRFNSMDLIYFRVRDKEHEGRYSYIPTWRLCDRSKDESGATNPVLINAIDGSMIDFYDEV